MWENKPKTKFHISNCWEKSECYFSVVIAAPLLLRRFLLFHSIAPFMIFRKPEHRFNDFTVVIYSQICACTFPTCTLWIPRCRFTHFKCYAACAWPMTPVICKDQRSKPGARSEHSIPKNPNVRLFNQLFYYYSDARFMDCVPRTMTALHSIWMSFVY